MTGEDADQLTAAHVPETDHIEVGGSEEAAVRRERGADAGLVVHDQARPQRCSWDIPEQNRVRRRGGGLSSRPHARRKTCQKGALKGGERPSVGREQGVHRFDWQRRISVAAKIPGMESPAPSAGDQHSAVGRKRDEFHRSIRSLQGAGLKRLGVPEFHAAVLEALGQSPEVSADGDGRRRPHSGAIHRRALGLQRKLPLGCARVQVEEEDGISLGQASQSLAVVGERQRPRRSRGGSLLCVRFGWARSSRRRRGRR